jgi:ubiquinone/menaquinone biosynthesis C-methylase UbiE
VKSVPEVSLLFNAKARSWDSKYRDKGPLAYRVAVFSALLAGRVRPGAAVLDFGGGTGAIASALALQGFRMTVCDLAEQMIAAGKQRYSSQAIEWLLLPQEWKRLPFKDSAFDAVIASSVFEYLADVDNVFAECRRILRPGGTLLFSVPNPAHITRRLERFLRLPAVFAWRIPPVRALPKIGNYLRYLQVSRARFSEAQWRQKASRVGFHPVPIEMDAPELAANRALLYLAFD